MKTAVYRNCYARIRHIRYEYDGQLAATDQSTDWADCTFDIESGDVPCPIKWRLPNELLKNIKTAEQLDAERKGGGNSGG